MAISARSVGALFVVAVLGGCSSDRNDSPGRDVAEVPSRPLGALASPEWQTRQVELSNQDRPVAFRAGGGLVALLQNPPPWIGLFILADNAHSAAHGYLRPIEPDPRLPIGIPSDIVGVSTQNLAWFLDPERGRVVSEDVGGYRTVIADLHVRGTVRTACALGERAIAFLDEARPGQVFVRSLTEPSETHAMSFPTGFVDTRDVRWTDLRFGGSPEGPCVLWAPHMHGVVVVSDSTVRPLGPFVESLRDEQKSGTWSGWLARWFTRTAPPVGALDATSVPGGVAVLFAGRTPYAGRLVDFYTETGQFLETMRLPYRARRIAGMRHRLLVLGTRGDSVYIASYVLPAAIRSLPVAHESDIPKVIPPPSPTGNALPDGFRVRSP